MTAQETYRKQQARERLEEQARELANQLAAEDRGARAADSQAWQHDPSYRALTARIVGLDAELTAEQETLGGVVYRVANANIEALAKKLDALNRRAAKHEGLGTVAYRVTDEVDVVEVRAPQDPQACADMGISPLRGGEVIGVERYTFVVLAAPRIKLAGWALLAKLTVEEAGVFVTKVPPFARAWARHREVGGDAGWSIETAETEAQDELEAINLVDYTDPAAASRCDHCGLARRRTATYVVENLTTGERKQVGSNCLRDFLGVDPHAFARYAEWLRDLHVSLSDEEGGFGRATREVAVTDYLTHVCTVIRESGWAARSSSDHPTADQAESNLYNFHKGLRDRLGNPLWIEPTDADAERARAALAWAGEHLGAKVNQTGDASDFDRNLYVASQATVLTDRIQGTLAYLPVAHARFLEREIEFARRKEQDGESDYVGVVGDRTELTLTVTHVFETEGDYGTTFITVLRDAAGNAYKWFGSYELDRGATYVGTWTVKKHEEWKGTKQTVVTRPAKLRPADVAQTQLTEVVA